MSAGNGGRTPWQDQLESTFEDEGVRQQVDDFLRGSVQPYVTQLEQRTQVPDEAQRLYNDLTENPGDTYVALTEELFGQEAADRVVELIQGGAAPAEAAAQAQEEAAEAAPASGLTAEQQQVLEWAQNKATAEQYDEALADVKERFAEYNIVDELFHPFVAAADGDFEAAAHGYNRYMELFREANGLSSNEEALEVLDVDGNPVGQAPPVLNSNTPGGSGATQVEQKQTMDEAMSDFVNIDLAKAPPVLGAV